MDNDRALTILNKAYDTLENLEGFEVREVDPFEEDAMDRWQRLRAQSREPAPQPRQRKLDTAAARDAAQSRWDQWCDARVDAALRSYDLVVGQAIGQHCERVSREVRRLEKALDAARLEIKRLKAATRSKASEQGRVIGWKLDRPKYRVVPFYDDGRPGTPLPLRPLFEQFFEETGIGSRE